MFWNPFRRKPKFDSAPELVFAVQVLIADMRKKGPWRAADELQQGLGMVDGGTEGWVLLLDQIERARRVEGVSARQRSALKDLRDTVQYWFRQQG